MIFQCQFLQTGANKLDLISDVQVLLESTRNLSMRQQLNKVTISSQADQNKEQLAHLDKR